MLTEINTLEDVKQFAYELTSAGIVFHCDDDFNDYFDFNNNTPCFTSLEADNLNKLMAKCFEVCEKSNVDIYEVMNTDPIIDKLIQEKEQNNNSKNK